MSNLHAIGGVSETLKTLLADRMELPGGVTSPIIITIGKPPPEPEPEDTVPARINLFLYRATENPIKNQEIRGQGDRGAYGIPPLSLDLHYLITAYGRTAGPEAAGETLSHFLLGSALRVLHDYPIITKSLETKEKPKEPILHDSLRGDFENIKLYLEPLSLDDLSKVWTALTTPFRLSVAYMVSVVQIESHLLRRYPKRVGEPPKGGPRIRVLPFRFPHIDEINVIRSSTNGDDPVESRFAYARIGDTLILRGHDLVGDNPPRVTLGTVVIKPDTITLARDDRIEVPIPDDPAIQPGPNPVKVAHQLAAEDGQPRPVYDSNLAVFVLVPRVKQVEIVSDNAGKKIQVSGKRLAHEKLDSLILVGDKIIRPELSKDTGNKESEIKFPIPEKLIPGEYPVRVRVNGAESIDDVKVTIPTV